MLGARPTQDSLRSAARHFRSNHTRENIQARDNKAVPSNPTPFRPTNQRPPTPTSAQEESNFSLAPLQSGPNFEGFAPPSVSQPVFRPPKSPIVFQAKQKSSTAQYPRTVEPTPTMPLVDSRIDARIDRLTSPIQPSVIETQPSSHQSYPNPPITSTGYHKTPTHRD